MAPFATEEHLEFPIRRVELLNWIIAGVLSLVAWACYPLFIAQSVFIGGLMANISYLILKKNLRKLLQGRLLRNGNIQMAKTQFYLKYYIRLAIIAVILYHLVSRHYVHPLGLLIGLSTVVFSIGITVTSVIKKFYFTAKEA